VIRPVQPDNNVVRMENVIADQVLPDLSASNVNQTTSDILTAKPTASLEIGLTGPSVLQIVAKEPDTEPENVLAQINAKMDKKLKMLEKRILLKRIVRTTLAVLVTLKNGLCGPDVQQPVAKENKPEQESVLIKITARMETKPLKMANKLRRSKIVRVTLPVLAK